MSTRTPSGSGGVRNLRAMFENKGGDLETSPPSRGRSPAASDASAQSRPISKVRASFVAVERPGDLAASPQQWGLRKASDVSSMAEVKEEVRKEQEGENKSATEAIEEEPPKLNGSTSKTATVPNGADTQQNVSTSTPKGEKVMDSKTKPAAPPTTTKDAPKAKTTTAKPTSTTEKAKATEQSKKDVSRPAKINTSKDSTTGDLKRKPSKLSTTSKTSSPRTPKTPTTPVMTKPTVKGSPHKPAAVAASAARARENASKATATTSAKPASSSTAKSARPETKDTQKPIKPGETVTTGGFVKPRPKSPTRPVRLPAAATSTTAASAAKTGAPSEGSSLARKPSTLKRDRVPPSAGLAKSSDKTTRASLSHFDAHRSTGSHAREKERPRSRLSTSATGKAPDEGFLERMMRPTASSASKVHDKAELPPSPPGRRESGTSKSDAKSSAGTGIRRTSSISKKTNDHVTTHPKKQEPKKEAKAVKPSSHPQKGKPADKEFKVKSTNIPTREPAPMKEEKVGSEPLSVQEPGPEEKENLVKAVPAVMMEPKIADVIPQATKEEEPQTSSEEPEAVSSEVPLETTQEAHPVENTATTEKPAEEEQSLPSPLPSEHAEKQEDDTVARAAIDESETPKEEKPLPDEQKEAELEKPNEEVLPEEPKEEALLEDVNDEALPEEPKEEVSPEEPEVETLPEEAKGDVSPAEPKREVLPAEPKEETPLEEPKEEEDQEPSPKEVHIPTPTATVKDTPTEAPEEDQKQPEATTPSVEGGEQQQQQGAESKEEAAAAAAESAEEESSERTEKAQDPHIHHHPPSPTEEQLQQYHHQGEGTKGAETPDMEVD